MKKIKTIIFIMFLMLFAVPFKVFAVDKITFSINGVPGALKPGDTFTITVHEEGANDGQMTLSEYNLTLNYDANILTLQSGSSTITGKNVTGSADVASLAFVVNAVPKGGTTNLSITGDCNINGEVSKDKCTLNGATVKVREISTDSTLSGLSIPNTTLTPAFNKNTHEYNAEVNDVTQLTIKATATDPNASIQISENYKSLQKGNNDISIVVAAENGKKTTYTIHVNASFTPTEEELMKANANLSALEIKGQKIDFTEEEVKYYLDVPYNVTSLEITPTAVNPNAQIQISGADKFIVGKNTVNIVVTAEDTTTTKTYSILVTRLQENKKIIPTCPDTTSTKEWIIFSIGLFLTFTLGIVLGYVLGKKDILSKIFKKKEKEEEVVELDDISDTIDLSDVVEEIKEDEDVKKA